VIKLTPQVVEGFVGSCLASRFDDPAKTPQFHRDLWDLCCSDARLVAVAAPRAHAKSTAVSLAYLLAAVLFRQSQFVLLLSDTEGQAKDFLGDIKKELQTNEDIIGLFDIKDMPKDTETDIIVRFHDGYVFRIIAKGSEQKVRGLKWNHKRPDLIIGDDLENDEIVMNPDRREKFRNWMMKALLPCLAPHGKVRIVGTILHLDSFLARICPMEGEKMTVREGLKLVSKNSRAMWKSVVYAAHAGSNPSDIKNKSDILWSERFDKKYFQEKYLEAVELGMPEAYAQEQLNRPLDDTHTLFRKTDFVGMTESEKEEISLGKRPLLHYCGIDLAISEKERADYSVFHVVGLDAKGYIFHRKTIRDRMDGLQIVNTILALQTQYDLQWVAIEQDKIGKAIGSFLREKMLETGVAITLVPITPSADKTQRTRSIQARMRAGGVKFDKNAEEYHGLETEFLQFPRGRHDDQVDAFSCIGLALDKMTVAQTREEEIEDEYERDFRLANLDSGRSAVTGY
jgi:predicted phage terminase large subunit-like protein